MEVVLLQILQWMLRIILFLLFLIVVLAVIVLIVPIRYGAEGEILEKKPGIRGKITWFFYLIYMKFAYEENFRIEVRVLGIKVYDSVKESVSAKGLTEEKYPVDESEKNIEVSEKHTEYSLADFEKEMETAEREEAKITDEMRQAHRTSAREENMEDAKENSLSDKLEMIGQRIQNMIQKIKNIISKIQEGKLKAEHYLELWNRKETQITFGRAKTKLSKIIKAVLPRKWNVIGEIGFEDPSTTGQLIGILGVMYPIIGGHVQITPDFEEKVMSINGKVKGHIRLGNLLYQLISLVLNVHCFKFIKLVLDELGGSKKSKQQNE